MLHVFLLHLLLLLIAVAGFLQLLSQLTVVGDVSKDAFEGRAYRHSHTAAHTTTQLCTKL